MDRYSLLFYLFVGFFVTSCTSKGKFENFERVLSFDTNLIETKDPEFVCQLSEDSVFLKDVINFTLLNDTSFVVVDGRGAYLYHISGTFKKQFGSSGRAGGEMISPSLVYATSNLVYIWCTSLMKFVIFDHDANFKNELTDFKKAVKKFVVNPSNEILYVYTSGYFDETKNKMTDVIDIYNISEGSSKKYGERSPEDEVLSVMSNSGGLLCVDTDRLVYLHPGDLILYDFDMNSEKTVRYKIEDKAFNREIITTNARNIIDDRPRMREYLHKNSVVIDLYKDNAQFIIVSEIGQYDFNEQTRVMNTKERKVKLYILDSYFNPKRSILYDYIDSPNIAIHSNYLYFITLMVSDDQIFSLCRFSLSEE